MAGTNGPLTRSCGNDSFDMYWCRKFGPAQPDTSTWVGTNLGAPFSMSDTGVTVDAALAISSAEGLVPTLKGYANVTSPSIAISPAAGLVPTVEGDANVLVPVGLAAAAGLIPTISAGTGVEVTPVVGTATAAGLEPTVTANAEVQVPIGLAVAAGLVPTIATGTGVNIIVPLGTALAAGLVPTIRGDAIIMCAGTTGIGRASAEGLSPIITTGTVMPPTPPHPHGGGISYMFQQPTAELLQEDDEEVLIMFHKMRN